jgi:hypothetical protein
MPLTPKQQRFVEEYLANGHDAAGAYRTAYTGEALDWRGQSACYVYALVAPTTGAIFYVGKGTGNRCQHHAREALGRNPVNPRKTIAIQDLAAAGLVPDVLILATGLVETDAYSLERAVIVALHGTGLTNGSLPIDATLSWKLWAEGMLRRWRRFDDWLTEEPRSEADVRRFHVHHGCIEWIAQQPHRALEIFDRMATALADG